MPAAVDLNHLLLLFVIGAPSEVRILYCFLYLSLSLSGDSHWQTSVDHVGESVDNPDQLLAHKTTCARHLVGCNQSESIAIRYFETKSIGNVSRSHPHLRLVCLCDLLSVESKFNSDQRRKLFVAQTRT